MTARVVIACDGDWNGMPCRGALPTRTEAPALARTEAAAAGWSLDVDGDLCPAHVRRAQAPCGLHRPTPARCATMNT